MVQLNGSKLDLWCVDTHRFMVSTTSNHSLPLCEPRHSHVASLTLQPRIESWAGRPKQSIEPVHAEACRRKQTSKEAAQNIERMHTRLCVQAARAAHLTLASRHHTAWCSCLKSANAILVRNYQIWMIHSPINLRKSQKNHKLRFP